MVLALALWVSVGNAPACLNPELRRSRTGKELRRVSGCRYSPRILSAGALNSTFLMTEWNIQGRSHACQACEKPFADKQSYHTLLAFERHDLARQDVCEACWTAQFAEGAKDRKGFISHWVGEYQAPPPAPPEPIQKETAETLLRKLMEKNDPQFRAASFILAVMLERKKLLKVKAQLKENGQRVFVYEQPKTGGVHDCGPGFAAHPAGSRPAAGGSADGGRPRHAGGTACLRRAAGAAASGRAGGHG